MIVVAVASAALRFADFSDLAGPGAELMISGGSAALAGLIYEILNRRHAMTLLANLAFSAILVIAFVIGAHAIRPDNDMRIILPLAYAYLAAWIGAGWLDKHAIRRPLQRENEPRAELRVVRVANEETAG
jgi:hypothetical protein